VQAAREDKRRGIKIDPALGWNEEKTRPIIGVAPSWSCGHQGRSDRDGPEEDMSGAADASSGETAATELTDLAQKLSELRAHLQRVAADLNARREHSRAIHNELGPATGRPGLGNSASAGGRLCCHECGRLGPIEATGWTLRLCGDDQLHAFCPDCDYRYFNGNNGSASAAGPTRVS
jgi:hypothetical protein